MWTRRSFGVSGAACAALAISGARVRFAQAATPDERRLAVVILRGGLDGLAAVPPIADPDYASVREALALPASGDGAAIPLDGFFALHPALKTCGEMWRAKELAIVHNAATPYADRSHFDAQNMLESGGVAPHRLGDGWLNRALAPLGLDGNAALAVSPSPPLMLAGQTPVSSWQPSQMPAADEDFLARVERLYASDPVLSVAFRQGMSMRATAETAAHGDNSPADMRPVGARNAAVAPLMRGAGALLAAPSGPRIAVFDVGGWDTHFNQGAAEGQLARRLQALDEGLAAFRSALGPVWQKTAIVAASEFGRTAGANGTGGTDHGTAGAVLVMGGAVQGGSIHAEWRGLKTSALHEGRDLPRGADMRSVFKSALADHLGMPRRALEERVFPDSASAPPLRNLFRA
jgi:uncharacterized protein (DUF1501 family)